MTAVLVATGIALLGGAGAVARFLLDGTVQERLLAQFPAGTFVVNTGGSFALGVVTGLALGHRASLLVAAGLLGSFTTFSTWVFEAHRLAEEGEEALALATFAVGLAAGIGGLLLGRTLGDAL
jgi:fluoride exporter